MSSRMKEFRYISQLDKDNISAFEDINEDDRKKGMNYVWEKMSLFYKDCLSLGPKYKVDWQLAGRIREAIERKNEKT